jgi:hypothetical protein
LINLGQVFSLRNSLTKKICGPFLIIEKWTSINNESIGWYGLNLESGKKIFLPERELLHEDNYGVSFLELKEKLFD